MVKILVNNNKIHNWNKFSNGYVKGFAFLDTTLLTEEEIYSLCINAYKNKNLDNLLYKLNGHFSIILTFDYQTVAIADKLKTYPIFYFYTDKGLVITDTADIVLNRIPQIKLNSLSVKEYLSAGYVSENKTLLEGCNIVSASSYIIFEEKQVSEKEYYSQSLLPELQPSKSFNTLVTDTLEKVMYRMSKVLKNRTIVIPLSSGYDSRLIACLCKKHGFKNVICYSYGIKDSTEIKISQQVAQRLSFPWHNVEYTYDKWEKLINSPLFEKYMRYGGNLNTIPHIQDLLAIKELLEKKLIPTNSVIIPGHSGDLIGGSHLPNKLSPKDIGNRIFEKYFDIHLLKKKYQKEVIFYLNTSIKKHLSIDSEESSLQAFHLWNIRNRQANFIINSVRAYELNNLDWYLPLWDDEFEQLWNALPCKIRIGSKLYNDLLFKEYFKPYNVAFYKPVSETQLPLHKQFLRRIFTARDRYILKEIFSKIKLYHFKKDVNALDMVGSLIEKKDFDKENKYILLSRHNSMCMKSLFYLSLLLKEKEHH